MTSVRIPPDSTGKKILTTLRRVIGVNTITGIISVNDTLVGQSSGASGTVTSVETTASGNGVIYLKDFTATAYVDNEVLEINNSPVAVVASEIIETEDAHIQNVVVTDPENPWNRQKIDRFGATVNTFTDGAPVFGAFGTMTVGEPQTIKDYSFVFDDEPNKFWDDTTGSGSISFNTNSGSVVLTTGTTSGDKIVRTSNFYHPYSPGVGQVVDMSLRLGDNGKVNLRRRWGYFDDNNGVFFELDGTTLNVVLRSNVSGSVVDTRVPASEFSDDSLDGTDSEAFVLDVSKPNIYWIDLQWLGAGRVRCGVYEPLGAKITAHVFKNANASVDFPYMRTASLPLRFEQENTGSVVSSSELQLNCAAVRHSSRSQIVGDKFAANSGLKTVTTASGEVPIMALRPKTTFAGVTNRAIFKGVSSNFLNVINTGGGPVLFRIHALADASGLTGSSFVSHRPDSTVEIDTSSTAINTSVSKELSQVLIVGGENEYIRDLDDRTLHTYESHLNADGVTQPVFVVTAECLTGTNADVMYAVNWEEIKF